MNRSPSPISVEPIELDADRNPYELAVLVDAAGAASDRRALLSFPHAEGAVSTPGHRVNQTWLHVTFASSVGRAAAAAYLRAILLHQSEPENVGA